MRMAADQLGGQRLDDVAEGKGALLFGHPGMKNDLQQQVAQLIFQAREVTAGNGVRNLVGLLKRVGSNRPEILLEIPRATRSGRSERRHDLKQARNVAGRLHWRGHGTGAGRSIAKPYQSARRAATAYPGFA
jgi:hypothetical protein